MSTDGQIPTPNVDPLALWNERSYLSGIFLGAVAFGVHLTIFIQCFQILFKGRRTRQDVAMLCYISLLFILGNIGNGANLKFTQMIFIDHRDYPGGPSAYLVEQSTHPVEVLCNSVYIVNSWLQDALLLYRFYVFWWGNRYLLIIPGTMFLTSVVLSLLLIVELCQPGKTLWSEMSVNLAIPYWSISIALNVLITTFIAARLIYMRQRLRKVYTVASGDYLSITAMLVESAALYSINGLVFLISYAVGSAVQNLALPALGQTQSIAPILIILRVARGRAWSKATVGNIKSNTEGIRMELNLSSRAIAAGGNGSQLSGTIVGTGKSGMSSKDEGLDVGSKMHL